MTLRALLLATAVSLLGACSVTDFTPAEKEMLDTMGGSAYQPATRELRDGIETQDLLAQASFWSREYQLNPADLESTIKLAAAVRKMGNPGRAAEITQTTRALHPDDPYLAAEHAAALVASERGAEALPVIERTLRTAPGYARLWSLRGAALDQAERFAEARQSYGRALSITPYDPNVLANMGLSFALEGNPREGLGWLERAANLPGASASVSRNLELVRELAGTSAPVPAAPRQASLASAPAGMPVQRGFAPGPAAPAPQPTAPRLSQPRMSQPQMRRPQPSQSQPQYRPQPTRPQTGPRSGMAGAPTAAKAATIPTGPDAPIATYRAPQPQPQPLRATDSDALHRLAGNASAARRAVMQRRPVPGPMPGTMQHSAQLPPGHTQARTQPAPTRLAPSQSALFQSVPPHSGPTHSGMTHSGMAHSGMAPARSPFAPRTAAAPQPAPQPAPAAHRAPAAAPSPAPALRGPSRPR